MGLGSLGLGRKGGGLGGRWRENGVVWEKVEEGMMGNGGWGDR